MNQRKLLFIDRDGTLIEEPADEQIDDINKLKFMPGVFTALSQLIQAGYNLVMVSNQDGLGTASLPHEKFLPAHELMLAIFASQGINFEAVLICPHFQHENCACRKPKAGLLMDYLTQQQILLEHSYVIGDRETDMQLAKNLGISSFYFGQDNFKSWPAIAEYILSKPRIVTSSRVTKETQITTTINLDHQSPIDVKTGIGFFDHMLEQLAKHGGFSLTVKMSGDLEIDEHHTVEDTAIAIGDAMRAALADKRGIHRYGFVLPMDEALATVAIDLSGRSYFSFTGEFTRDKIGDFPTELVPHFFHSFADALKAALHIKIEGENNHHMIEAIFKSVGRCLKKAITKSGSELPTTKGCL